MASISTDKPSGRRTVQFVGVDGRRRSLRLGKVTAKQAETARHHVESMLACLVTGSAVQASTAEWVASAPDNIRGRLERAGLVGRRERAEIPTLGAWLDEYLLTHANVKEGTKLFRGHTKRNLLTFFGADRRLDTITPGDADEFRIHLSTKEGLAENTVRRRLRLAKQFFEAAVRKRLIESSPFAHHKTADRRNEAKFHYITGAEAQAVLDACPDAQWRVLFALCRFGGLRCPSEVLRLRWGDVDWARERFTVHASKTEHHENCGGRVVPIFPQLMPHLREAWELAEPGTEYVVNRYRDTSANLRTQLCRIMRRAGLQPWPKLFQNLRSTCETELTRTHPIHVVCSWIGNSQPVAVKHYLQVTEEDYEKVVQNPVQYDAALNRIGLHGGEVVSSKPLISGTLREGAIPRDLVQMAGLEVVLLETKTPLSAAVSPELGRF
ncbi:MAG TPA: integrase [Phycisphaerales bacterium]|nr:integrase [Phycisphaerales bacterium]